MKAPRGLSEAERALWESLARTVTPLERERPATPVQPAAPPPPLLEAKPQRAAPAPRGRKPPPLRPAPPPPKPERLDAANLDSHWERRLRGAAIAPDFTLDLHGHTLEQAHTRLDRGLAQAKAMDARLVLVIAGRPRPIDPADRATSRGAIRAKILDWLAAGPHAQDVAAVRPAQRRHGGAGAVYLVLRRRR